MLLLISTHEVKDFDDIQRLTRALSSKKIAELFLPPSSSQKGKYFIGGATVSIFL